MIKVNMFSSADKVKGQGVGSAYLELIRLLQEQARDEIEMTINRYQKTQLSHYHTIDPLFYLTTFFRKRFGRLIGYVHFVPNTLKESIKIPKFAEKILDWYVVSFYKHSSRGAQGFTPLCPMSIFLKVKLLDTPVSVSVVPHFAKLPSRKPI